MTEVNQLSLSDKDNNLGDYLNSITPKPKYWDELKNYLIYRAKKGEYPVVLREPDITPEVFRDIGVNEPQYQRLLMKNNIKMTAFKIKRDILNFTFSW